MHLSWAHRWWILSLYWGASLGICNHELASANCADALTTPAASNYALASDVAYGRDAYQVLRREFAYRIATPENYVYHLARDGQITQVIQRYAGKLAMLEYFRTREGKEVREYLGRKLQKQILHDLRSFYPLYLKELAKRLPPLGSASWRYQEIPWHGQMIPALLVTIDASWKSGDEQTYAALPALQKLDQLAQQIKQLWQNAELPGKVNLAVTHRGLWNDSAVKNLGDLLLERPANKVRVENGTFYLPWFIFEDIPETTQALAGSLEHYRWGGQRLQMEDGRQIYNFAEIDARWNQIKEHLNGAGHPGEENVVRTSLAQKAALLDSVYERTALHTHLTYALSYVEEAIHALAQPRTRADLGVQLAYHPYPTPYEDVRQLWRGPGYVAMSFTGHALRPAAFPHKEFTTPLASLQINIPVLTQPTEGQDQKAFAAQVAADIMRNLDAWALAALKAEQQRLQDLVHAVKDLGPLPTL